MEKRMNPFAERRKRAIKRYVIGFAGSLLAGLLFSLIGSETNIRFFSEVLTVIFAGIMAIMLVLLVPFLIYVSHLGQKAKQLDETRQESDIPTAPRYDSVGDIIPEGSGARRKLVYDKYAEEKCGPWWATIVMLIIFPPIGVLMIFLKVYREKQHTLDNSLMLRSLGQVYAGFALVLGVLLGLLGISEGISLVKMLAFPATVLVFAAVLLVLATVLGNKGKLIARCQKLVWIHAVTSLDLLAKQLDKPYGETVAFFQKLIDDGFLFTCYLDFAKREIVSPVVLPKEAKQCPHCGGTTVFVAGTAAVCDYCGRVLK